MDNIDFQKVYDLIEESLPIGWKKVVVYCVSIKDSYEVKYYIKNENEEYIDCFDLMSSKVDIIRIISELSLILCFLNSDFTSITIMISNTGDFNSIVDYSRDKEDLDTYIMNWKEKYLI